MSNTVLNNTGLWRIRLFGSVEVTTPTGDSISVTSKKTGELLACLAVHPGRAHSREKLVDVIWGDSEVGDARARLRQEILSLRSLIAPSDDSGSPFEITKDSCRLSPETVTDAVRFEETSRLARQETDFRLKLGLYRSAIALYTADLLPGYDSAWIGAERARLSQCFSRALFDLAEALRELKDYSGAEESLGSLKKHDPLSEECYIALMRLHVGDPNQCECRPVQNSHIQFEAIH
jgi:DNA-binding SARP family transcriptional activator